MLPPPDPCPCCGKAVHPIQTMDETLALRSVCPECHAPVDKMRGLGEVAEPQTVGAGSLPVATHPRALPAVLRQLGRSGDPVEILRTQLAEIEARIPTRAQLVALQKAARAIRRAIATLEKDAAPSATAN